MESRDDCVSFAVPLASPCRAKHTYICAWGLKPTFIRHFYILSCVVQLPIGKKSERTTCGVPQSVCARMRNYLRSTTTTTTTMGNLQTLADYGVYMKRMRNYCESHLGSFLISLNGF